MLSLALGVALSAAAPVKLASPGLTLVGVDSAKGAYFSQKLAASMASDALNIVTAREMEALLGLERQRQMLGCSEGSSCLAELGAALGADGILLGDLAFLGKRYELTVKVVSSVDGKVLVIRTGKAESEDELSDLVANMGPAIAAELLPKLGRQVPASMAAITVESSSGGIRGPRRFFWVPIVIGGVALIGSVVLALAAEGAMQPVRDANGSQPIDLDKAQRITATANGLQTAALVLLCTAGAAALVSAGLGIFGAPPEVKASAWLAPGGAGLALGGALP